MYQVRYLIEVQYFRDVDSKAIKSFFGAVDERVKEVESRFECEWVIVRTFLRHNVYARYYLRYPFALLCEVTASLLKLPFALFNLLHLRKLLNPVDLLLDLFLQLTLSLR